MKQAGVVIGAAVLVVAIAVGGWVGGWWLREEATNRTTAIANDSLARQSALVDSVLDRHRTALDIDVQLSTATPDQAAALHAQRTAVVNQFCDDYVQLTGRMTVPSSIDTFAAQEC